MRRMLLVAVLALATAAIAAPVALAVSPHLMENPVAFTDNGLDILGRGSYAGLGTSTPCRF